jgi:hypothetical protein
VVVGVLAFTSSPPIGFLLVLLGAAGIFGWWKARTETNGWWEDGPAWISLGRVIGFLFQVLIILTILGYILAFMFGGRRES